MSPGKTNESLTGTIVPDLRLAPKLLSEKEKEKEMEKSAPGEDAFEASNFKPFVLHKPQVESSAEDLYEHIKKIKLHRRKSVPTTVRPKQETPTVRPKPPVK
jgi:hypothetical protein